MIDRVIVHECREVNELDRGRESHSLFLGPVLGGAAQKHQRGTEHLSTHCHQVLAHLREQRRIANDRGGHLLSHIIELCFDGRLNPTERVSFARCVGCGGRLDARRDHLDA
jgi:extradiol dioxygenase family protein